MTSFTAESTCDEVAQCLHEQIKGKIVLITGCSPKGLGAESARVIALHSPELLILAGRSLPSLQATVEGLEEVSPGVKFQTLELDLAHQASIRNAAAKVNSMGKAIDVLINNAGIMASPFSKTIDGIESQFGTNHIGHFLFTNLIINRLFAASNGGRIINVTSSAYNVGGVRFDDVNFESGEYNKWAAYGQSKSANILFSQAIARRIKGRGILSFSLHPGAIGTNISRDILTSEIEQLRKDHPHLKPKSLAQGAATHIVAAFDPSIERFNGGYLEDCQIAVLSENAPWVQSAENADKLWELSENILGEKFRY